MGGPDDDTPAWWIEGAAIVFPNIWLRNNWQNFSVFRGLSFSDVDVEGMDLERWYRDTKRAAQGVSHQGNRCNDYVFGPAEESYETMRCFLGMANAYLAYLTSFQMVWVSIPNDVYDLGFEKSFRKHTNMSLQEFYEKCNAMKRDRDDTDFRPIAQSYEQREDGCVFSEMDNEKYLSENELCYATRDINPVTSHHALIIPKRHVPDFFDLYQPEINAVHALLEETKKEIKGLDETVTGFNVGLNSGEDAGQTIFHCHIHLIPRRKIE
jgi:diadenosine tetraphosphate (Ap4A) HIT family hydrolase